MRGLFLKLRRRRRLHQDLETELAFHREMAAAHGNAIPLGNATVIKEEALGLWRFRRVENLWRDLRYAARSLRRSPALVCTALLSLGLGIGVNATIFSLGISFLFSEPTVTDAGSLVSVRLGGNSHAKPAVLDFMRQAGLFRDVTGENEESFINWNDGVETHRIFCVYTAENYFTALGIPMAFGRGYAAGDPREVVVLRYRFWRKHFHGDASVVGRAINLDGRAYTVLGILPERQQTLLGFGWTPDVYVPYFLKDSVLAIYARLKPGMTLAEARAGVRTIARRMDAALPERWKYEDECTVNRIAGFGRLGEESGLLPIAVFFAIVLVLVGMVLLIACVNVASLLLARASARQREIAIRVSLGATRARLFQQLFVESLLLSLAGAGLGLLLCASISIALESISLPAPVPIRFDAAMDWRVALYGAFLTVCSTVACGLLPAWRSMDVVNSSAMARSARMRLGRALVVAQVAVAVIVLATGLLFLHNLLRSNSSSPGFDVRHTLRAEVNLPPAKYMAPRHIQTYVDEALRRLAALPGIEAAAGARIIPFTDATRMGTDLLFADGKQVHAAFHWNAVTPEFFDAMAIPILAGRAFNAGDSGRQKVAIVNRTFVEDYLGRRDPIGAVFRWGREGDLYEIVGVAQGTKNITIGEEPRPQMYVPMMQVEDVRTRLQFVLRSATPPATQLGAVRRTLRHVEPGAGLEVMTMFSSVGVAFLPSQIGAVILGSLGGLGLLLAMIGLYGVMTYSVTRRRQEIGVRIAIGASRLQICGMVVREASTLLLAGSILGVFIAVFAMRPLSSFLVPGLTPEDPMALGGVVVCLVATGMASICGPLRRAVGVEAAESLRYE